ncbi:hypothetical protein J2X68_008134 [Streptomyces sp. 3330]|uniref:hypothetical protein n=1 Tax=Streptomyces sp. 3330 TaxID=2817755 RepID=UPI0028598289|nr:hypothetical protein [Streptomyces sp. 3330]MDR6981389.1 hypothetical protein [Streptomyces sp. 3330]
MTEWLRQCETQPITGSDYLIKIGVKNADLIWNQKGKNTAAFQGLTPRQRIQFDILTENGKRMAHLSAADFNAAVAEREARAADGGGSVPGFGEGPSSVSMLQAPQQVADHYSLPARQSGPHPSAPVPASSLPAPATAPYAVAAAAQAHPVAAPDASALRAWVGQLENSAAFRPVLNDLRELAMAHASAHGIRNDQLNSFTELTHRMPSTWTEPENIARLGRLKIQIENSSANTFMMIARQHSLSTGLRQSSGLGR